MIIRRALLLCALLFAPVAFSADISGIWKHAKNPAWIEIRLQEGSGTVEWVRVDIKGMQR